MEKRNSIIVGVVVLLLIGLGVWWFLKPGMTEAPIAPSNDGLSIDTIRANHFWKDGVHLLEGNITLPTPCYELTQTARVAESAPEQATVDFVVNKTNDVCTQVIDEKLFSVNFRASKEAQIKATLNGKPVILELIESGSVKGDTIEKL